MEENQAKRIKVTCNLTGTVYSWTQEYAKGRLQYYGDMATLLKYFVQWNVVKHIIRGKKLEDLSRLFGFEIDHSKDLYYKELLAFHINKAKENKKVRVQSTATNIETDEEVASFISNFQDFMNE